MKSVELFTGAGGLALGISMSGFKHLAVVENDKYACDTLSENQRKGAKHISDWPILPFDVRDIQYDRFSEEVDLVGGGPPCQPFSLGGKHKAYRDSRDMFPQAVRAVRELEPRAFIFENVKGLTRRSFANYFHYIYLQLTYPEITRSGGEEWTEHLARLERHHTSGEDRGLSYKVVTRLLNAADYGVPQRRERVFFVGFRRDVTDQWSFPKQTHSEDALLHEQWVSGEYWERHEISKKRRPEFPARLKRRVEKIKSDGKPISKSWRTVRDAVSDLPNPSVKADDTVLNHKLIPGAKVYPGHTGSPIDLPGKTLKAGVHGVPGGENMIAFTDGSVRYLTVREAARLQTFPDDYIFHGSWTETMRQLGNAVPVNLSAAIAKSVAQRLKTVSRARKRSSDE